MEKLPVTSTTLQQLLELLQKHSDQIEIQMKNILNLTENGATAGRLREIEILVRLQNEKLKEGVLSNKAMFLKLQEYQEIIERIQKAVAGAMWLLIFVIYFAFYTVFYRQINPLDDKLFRLLRLGDVIERSWSRLLNCLWGSIEIRLVEENASKTVATD